MVEMNHLQRIKFDVHLISVKDVDWSFLSENQPKEISGQKNIEFEFTLGSFVGGRNMYTEIFTFEDLKSTNIPDFINSLQGKQRIETYIQSHFRLRRN